MSSLGLTGLKLRGSRLVAEESNINQHERNSSQQELNSMHSNSVNYRSSISGHNNPSRNPRTNNRANFSGPRHNDPGGNVRFSERNDFRYNGYHNSRQNGQNNRHDHSRDVSCEIERDGRGRYSGRDSGYHGRDNAGEVHYRHSREDRYRNNRGYVNRRDTYFKR